MRLNENTKITLTIAQLKKLVKESGVVRESFDDYDLTDVKAGDILCASWGGTMCLATFYRVIRRIGKTFELQELDSKKVSGDHMSGSCVPDESSRRGGIFRRRLTNRGSLKGKSDSECLKKWNGKPMMFDFWD